MKYQIDFTDDHESARMFIQAFKDKGLSVGPVYDAESKYWPIMNVYYPDPKDNNSEFHITGSTKIVNTRLSKEQLAELLDIKTLLGNPSEPQYDIY